MQTILRELFDKLGENFPDALAWGLTLVCPAVPDFVWLALIKAVVGGDVTLAHLVVFMNEHDIKVYPPMDIETPDARPIEGTNLSSGGYHDEGVKSM